MNSGIITGTKNFIYILILYFRDAEAVVQSYCEKVGKILCKIPTSTVVDCKISALF